MNQDSEMLTVISSKVSLYFESKNDLNLVPSGKKLFYSMNKSNLIYKIIFLTNQ